MVCLLMSYGADPTIRDGEGMINFLLYLNKCLREETSCCNTYDLKENKTKAEDVWKHHFLIYVDI